MGAPPEAMNGGPRRPFSDQPPLRQLMIWLRVIGTIGVVTLLVVAYVTRDPRLLRLLPTGDAVNVRGSVILNAAYGFYDNDRHCRGIGDYDDVTEGAHLTLATDTGQVLDVRTLGPGTPTQQLLGTVGGPCTFDFKIEGVRTASRAEFYTFTVAGHGPIQMRPRDLDSYVVVSLVR